MNITPGQLPSLAMAFVSAVIDAVTLFAPSALNVSEKTAIVTVASAAVALGVALYSYFGHSAAMKK